MDNFDLRKYLAESRQPIQEMDAPMMDAPMEAEMNPMEQVVAEYVTEALKGKDLNEVHSIIERHCSRGAMEMKMEVIHEVIGAYEGRITELEENAVFKEMLDETKMGAIKEIHKGLHEAAASLKEEYTKAFMPEQAVEEKKAPKKEKEEAPKEEKEEKKEDKKK